MDWANGSDWCGQYCYWPNWRNGSNGPDGFRRDWRDGCDWQYRTYRPYWGNWCCIDSHGPDRSYGYDWLYGSYGIYGIHRTNWCDR